MEASGTFYKREVVEQMMMEGEKTKRKLQKVQQRRDHYARLYYQTIMELDVTRLALDRARKEISDLQTQVARQKKVGVSSNTTSPDSGTSLSPGIDPLTRQPRAELQPAGGVQDTLEHTYDELPWPHTQDNNMQEKPARAPTGCPAPPSLSQPSSLSQPWCRRSLTLSQRDPVFPAQTSVPAAARVRSLTQDCSFSQPRKFERAFSMPHRIRPPLHLNTSRLWPGDDSTTVGAGEPAFKPLSPQVVHTSLPQRQSQVPVNSPNPSSLVCNRSEVMLSSLSPSELETVCSQLTSLSCPVRKLELSKCGLGQPDNMKLFCNYLVQNKSIMELSLPHNNIAVDSLSLLLDSLQRCPSIKELLLRHNLIGHECAAKIKEFLEVATIDALVLTGNGIEQHGHLLDGSLPRDFTMEYGRRRETRSVESEDSGVPQSDTIDNEHSSFTPVRSAFKQLHI